MVDSQKKTFVNIFPRNLMYFPSKMRGYFYLQRQINISDTHILHRAFIIVMIHYILKTFLDELILEYIQIYSILDIENLCVKFIHRKY